MSFFYDSAEIATTGDVGLPNFTVEKYKGPNVGQYGWTEADTSRYNQLIQYVDECRNILTEVRKVAASIANIDEQVKEVNRLYEATKALSDEANKYFDAFIKGLVDFERKYNNFNVSYADFIVKYNDSLVKYEETVANAASAAASAAAAKVSQDATAADRKHVQDLYDDLKNGQVYRGTWNPNSNAYPSGEGTNSIWDVILNPGQQEVVFDNKTWGAGDRLVYLEATKEYQQIATGSSGVKSVNGRFGAVTLDKSDVNLDLVPNTEHTANPTPSTVVLRDASGDVTGRLFRSTYDDESTMRGALAFRVNAETDNYTRFVSNKPSIRQWMDIPGLNTPNTFTGNQTLAGDLDVNGHVLVTGDATVSNINTGKVTATGAVVAGGGIEVPASAGISAGGDIAVGGKLTALGDVEVRGLINTHGVVHSAQFQSGTLRTRDGADPNTISTNQGLAYNSAIAAATVAPMPAINNANGVITVNTHAGNYYHQLGFSSNGALYHRDALDGAWSKVYTEAHRPSGADLGVVGMNGVAPADADFDTLDTVGYYKIQNSSTAPNQPAGYSYGMLEVIRVNGDGENRVTQVYYPHIGGNPAYRTRNAGGWEPWATFYTNLNKPTPGEIGAVPVTGGRMTGALDAQGGIDTTRLGMAGHIDLGKNRITGNGGTILLRNHEDGNVTLSGGLADNTAAQGDLLLGFNSPNDGYNTRKVLLCSDLQTNGRSTIINHSTGDVTTNSVARQNGENLIRSSGSSGNETVVGNKAGFTYTYAADGKAFVEDQNSSIYRIYHEGFKPNINDFNAAPGGWGLGTNSMLPYGRGSANRLMENGWTEFNADGGDSDGPVAYGNILHVGHKGNANAYSGWAAQLFFGTNGGIYTRTNRPGTFEGQGWNQVYTTAHKPNANDVGAISTNGGPSNGWIDFQSTEHPGAGRLLVGGNPVPHNSGYSLIYSSANLHLDAKAGNGIYLNHNNSGGFVNLMNSKFTFEPNGNLTIGNDMICSYAYANGPQPAYSSSLTRRDFVESLTHGGEAYRFRGNVGNLNDCGPNGSYHWSPGASNVPVGNTYGHVFTYGTGYFGDGAWCQQFACAHGAGLFTRESVNGGFSNWQKLALEGNSVTFTNVESNGIYNSTGGIQGWDNSFNGNRRTDGAYSVADRSIDGNIFLPGFSMKASTAGHGFGMNFKMGIYQSGNQAGWDNKSLGILVQSYENDAHPSSCFNFNSSGRFDAPGHIQGYTVNGSDHISGGRVAAGWDSGVAGSVSASSWFRSIGATGWYNETYGGGIAMEDANWVRVTHGKGFHVSNNTSNAINTTGGIEVGAHGGANSMLRLGSSGAGQPDRSSSSTITSTPNLHLDARAGYEIYLNHYSGTGVNFGNGADAVVARVDNGGNLSCNGNISSNRVSIGWDSGVAGSVSASSWFRSIGATGWYNETYGGGIYMEDNDWVRTYGGKSFHVNNTSAHAIDTAGGVFAHGNMDGHNLYGRNGVYDGGSRVYSPNNKPRKETLLYSSPDGNGQLTANLSISYRNFHSLRFCCRNRSGNDRFFEVTCASSSIAKAQDVGTWFILVWAGLDMSIDNNQQFTVRSNSGGFVEIWGVDQTS